MYGMKHLIEEEAMEEEYCQFFGSEKSAIYTEMDCFI